MDVAFITNDAEQNRALAYHLEPLGFSVTQFADALAFVDDAAEIEVDAVICDVRAFPRHWKPVVYLLRTCGINREVPCLLLAPDELGYEEAAKAAHLDVSGVVVGTLGNRATVSRLIGLLRRYGISTGERSSGRMVPEDHDRIGLALVHPQRLSVIVGDVLDISERGVAFRPRDTETAAELTVGVQLHECSLRLGEDIIDVTCIVRRAGASLGLEFVGLSVDQASAVAEYLARRAERALQARTAT